MTYRYRADVLDELATHGIRPRPSTAPSRIRDLLNDLYTYELRALRARLLRGEFPRPTYSTQVIAIRTRYPLLSLPVDAWLEATGATGPDAGRSSSTHVP
jgi:hypothetical protein